MFLFFVATFVAFCIGYSVWDCRRNYRRRKTLRQDDNGTWVWIDYGGKERCSNIHPDTPGGEWCSGGDGAGGDGGDGGGGGD